MSISGEDKKSELDAAAILLSLKSTPPSFPKINGTTKQETSHGYIPIYDWTQALPSLTQAGNTFNINLQMYNSPVRFVPVPLDDENSNSYFEMRAAFVKFCQIHKDTIVLNDSSLKPDEINEKLVQLWSRFTEEEKFVYSKVAKNETLLMQGKDIAKKEENYAPSLFRHPMFRSPSKSLPPKSQKIVKIKQRSLSLSDKSPRKAIVHQAISHDEPFAKPTEKDGPAYFIRVRRHSMNDGILDESSIEKINPYFTKNYTKLAVKPKIEPQKEIDTPKRKPLDLSWNIKSPPKRNRNAQSDIFDFKSDNTVKHEEVQGESERKGMETYSYSLLKGASKTSSVNPSFSSRKTIVKKAAASLAGKCDIRLKGTGITSGGGTESKTPDTTGRLLPTLPSSSTPSSSLDSLHSSFSSKCSSSGERESSGSGGGGRIVSEVVDDPVLISHAISELERAEKTKGGRRSSSEGDMRTKCVYELFRAHGLSPSPTQLAAFCAEYRTIYGSKSAALLSIREVKQKILKLQNV